MYHCIYNSTIPNTQIVLMDSLYDEMSKKSQRKTSVQLKKW